MLNGILLPIVLVFILILSSDKRLAGSLRDGRLSLILGWGTFVDVAAWFLNSHERPRIGTQGAKAPLAAAAIRPPDMTRRDVVGCCMRTPLVPRSTQRTPAACSFSQVRVTGHGRCRGYVSMRSPRLGR